MNCIEIVTKHWARAVILTLWKRDNNQNSVDCRSP